MLILFVFVAFVIFFAIFSRGRYLRLISVAVLCALLYFLVVYLLYNSLDSMIDLIPRPLINPADIDWVSMRKNLIITEGFILPIILCILGLTVLALIPKKNKIQ